MSMITRARRRQDIDRLQLVARQNGLYLSLADAIQLVQEHGPGAIQFIRDQARNPQDTSTVERRIFGPGNYFAGEAGPSGTPAIQERRRKEPVPNMMPMNVDTGNAGYVQLRYSKKKIKNGRRKKGINAVKKWVSHMRNDVIYRWQTLKPFSPSSAELRAQPFCLRKETVSTTDWWNMPMFAFNLSGSPVWDQNAGQLMNPFYRLRKAVGGAIPTKEWQWTPVLGVRNNIDGDATTATYPWVLEHHESKADTVSNLNFNEYVHEWSDIRLLLQGRTTNPMRYHIYIVQFLVDGVGPVRSYSATDGVTTTEVDANPSEETEVEKADYFWERFCAPKVVHPFANTKKEYIKEKRMKVISHEVVSIEAEQNTSLDVQPRQVMKRIFYRNGNTYKGDNVSAVNMGASGNVNDTQKPGFSNANTSLNATGGIPRRAVDQWLFIVAENYTSLSTAGEQTVATCGSVDLSVRSKYTVYDV